MSTHPTAYVPKSAFAKWFESRLPVAGLIHSSFIAFPVPRNLTYFWTFGAILSFMLVAQIVTGVFLAMYYTPSATMAFQSVEHIMRDVNYGWMLRYLHANGASMFFIAVYIHIFRGLYYGSYKAPRELLWILGCIIYLLMMATGFMGYVLPWGQMSFWGATVITGFFTAIPRAVLARSRSLSTAARAAVCCGCVTAYFSSRRWPSSWCAFSSGWMNSR